MYAISYLSANQALQLSYLPGARSTRTVRDLLQFSEQFKEKD